MASDATATGETAMTPDAVIIISRGQAIVNSVFGNVFVFLKIRKFHYIMDIVFVHLVFDEGVL